MRAPSGGAQTARPRCTAGQSRALAACYRPREQVPSQCAYRCYKSRGRVPDPRVRSRSSATTSPSRSAARSSGRCSALLLVHAGEVVSTDRLVDRAVGRAAAADGADLAPELRLAAPQAARRRTRSRRRPPGYVLRVEPGPLDLARFERLVAEARAARRRPSGSQLLREALALWRGPPLADLAFETFAQGEIRRLEELRLERARGADRRRPRARRRAASSSASSRRSSPSTRCASGCAAQLMLALYRCGPAGRGAGGLPRRAPRARRRARDRAGAGAPAALHVDPAPGARARRRPPRTASPEDHLGDVVRAILARPPRPGPRNRRDGGAGSPAAGGVTARLAERFDCPPDRPRRSRRPPSTRR